MTPTSEKDLAQIIAGANGPLRIKGGGTRPIGTTDGQTLETSGLSGISLFEPGALTMVAGAGTPIAEIEKTLRAENQRLAFEPMDHRALMGSSGVPTLGGVAAANVSGPRRIAVGAARDFMLGVRFVDGTGNIVKNGGRVMKNVTGYDLVKLLAGSYGTLGVLTEVSLKVLPDVETTSTVRLHGLSDHDAVAAMSAALGSPFEITGAAHLPKGAEGTPETLLRLEGFEASVSYRVGRMTELLKPYGEITVTEDDSASWTAIRDVTALAGTDGAVWRLSVKPSDGPDLVAKAKATQVQYDWGGGLVWLVTADGYDLRADLGDFDGHATLIKGDTDVPTFQPEAPALAAITAGLRAKFDPKGILNTGIMT